MATSPTIVVLFPRHQTSWVKIFEIGSLLRDRSDLHPIMFLPNDTVAANAEVCDQVGIDKVVLSERLNSAVSANGGILQRLVAGLIRSLKKHDRVSNCLPVSFLRYVATRRQLKAEYSVFREELERCDADIVIVPGDRELSPVPSLLRAARDLGLPTVIGASSSPYPEGVALSRLGYPRFSLSLRDMPPLLNFFVARFFPGQVLKTDNGRLLFSPGWLTLAHASLRMLSKNPWVQGGGLSTHILQHSRRRMDGFMKLGVDSDKLVPIGDQSHDTLYAGYQDRRRLRTEIEQEYAFDTDVPLIVVTVPNDAEHGVCDMEEHLDRMAQYFSALGRAHANALLCLHPKSEPETYRALAEQNGLQLASTTLVNALPAADVFVCSGSSTVLWAQLCNIPTINLDYWRVRDADFRDVEGIRNVETLTAFEESLKQLLDCEHGRTDFARHAEQVRANCFFDGGAGQRICDFLSGLAKNPVASRTCAN